MARKPKVLRYLWQDLTGSLELDYPVESFRLMYKAGQASGKFLQELQLFFEEHEDYLCSHTTSDLAVILYRFIEAQETEPSLITLSETNQVSAAVYKTAVKYAFMTRPIPIISGEPPACQLF